MGAIRRRWQKTTISSPLASVASVFLFVALSSLFANTYAKSGQPISDIDIRERKAECYADIQSGLWGWKCKSSMIEKENCALRCLSPVCYEHVYGGDPLEEGEKDYIRGQEFKYCMHRLSLGENLTGVKGAFNY